MLLNPCTYKLLTDSACNAKRYLPYRLSDYLEGRSAYSWMPFVVSVVLNLADYTPNVQADQEDLLIRSNSPVPMTNIPKLH